MGKTATTSGENESSSPQAQSAFDTLLSSAPAQLSSKLHPARNPHSWFLFRLFLGFFGAALVLLPLALPENWIASIFGLAFFLVAIMLPPSLKSHEGAEQSPVPAARIVLNGAAFVPEFAPPVPVEIFVSEEQILAMKQNLQPVAVIPTPQLSSVFLQRSGNSWLLFLHWSGKETAFSFGGLFAERHARKAEFAIRQYVRVAPPEKPKARAAGA